MFALHFQIIERRKPLSFKLDDTVLDSKTFSLPDLTIDQRVEFFNKIDKVCRQIQRKAERTEKAKSKK
jgi:hypothetical protein